MSWAGKSAKLLTVIEEDSFSKGVEKLGGAAAIDEALETAVCAVASRPDAFDEILGFPGIRLLKTDPIEVEGRSIPALRVWFRADDKLGRVHLLMIEAIPDGGQ